jgi:hypothetical protein
MKHKHHLIPRYLGGSNELQNLVEVSPTQHAMFHYCNWCLWGNEEDKIAWRALAGYSKKEEIIHQVISLAGKKGGKVAKESGQLRSAALKQPKSVRQRIGKNLINYAYKNPKNATQETLTNRKYRKVFHIYEKLTERTIGNHLGDVIFNPEEDKTLKTVCSVILEKYKIKVSKSHLNKVANGERLLTHGISCSWILENMSISSQATDDTSVEGSETTGVNKRVE